MEQKKHQRRPHYSGTHPKSYREKYKEHNPEKYADTIEKVIRKGGTPAGMHISICVREILDFLRAQCHCDYLCPDSIGVSGIRLFSGYPVSDGTCNLHRLLCVSHYMYPVLCMDGEENRH